MKWLILLMLIACGKHEEPKSVDLRDSDGDQIINGQEGEFEKYIADFETLKTVRGTIQTSLSTQEIGFSNHSDLKTDTMELMTGNIESEENDQYFSEWSEIKLDLPEEKIASTLNVNTLLLKFQQTEIQPDELALVKGENQLHLGKWADHMKVQISKEEFNDLMTGKAKLYLRKKFPRAKFFPTDSEESIRQKTYKVHTFGGKKSRILYVSKELSFEKLLSYLEIDSITKVNDEKLFFNSQEYSSSQWFVREFKNGNKAIIFSQIQNLKEHFRNKFVRTNMKLERQNGLPVSNLELNNKGTANVYMIVRPISVISRSFRESTTTTSHYTGNRNRDSYVEWICTHYHRAIENKVSTLPSMAEFFGQLNVKFSENEVVVNEQIDEKGIFWEVKILASQENLKLALEPLNSSTFTTTGEYGVQCGSGPFIGTAAAPANSEEKLSFEIESFVEKKD